MNVKIEDYIGDGVYVEWNGYEIILRAYDNRNPTDTIYLNEKIMDALQLFYNRVVLRGSPIEGEKINQLESSH